VKKKESALKVKEFARQIDAMRSRVTALNCSAGTLPRGSQYFGEQALEYLHTALEELQVTFEELAITRQALEAERHRYQHLFEFAPEACLVTDPAGTILEVNRTAATLLNCSQEWLAGKPLSLFVSQGDRRCFRSQLNRLRQNEQVREWTVRLCRHNGEPFDAQLSAGTLRDGEGNPAALRWLVREATSRQPASETQQIRERVLESMACGVSVSDEKGYILFANPAFEAMFGHAPGELTGSHVSILHQSPPEESAPTAGEITEGLQSLGTWCGERINRKKDGTLLRTRTRTRTLEISGKKYWISVAEDLALGRQAEEARLPSSDLYRAISELTSDYIYLAKITPGGELVTEWVSESFHRLTGYSTDELTAGGWLCLIHPDDLPKASEFIKTLSANQSSAVEYRIFTKQGDIRWLRDSARPEWDAGFRGAVRILGAVQDITERKRVGEELEKSLSLLQAALEASADGIIATDPEGNITTFNLQFLQMWRLPESAVERSENQVVALMGEQLKDPEGFYSELERLRKQPETVSYENLEFKDGRVFACYSQPQRLGEEIAGRVFSFRNISFRAQTKKMLQESQERYRAVVEQSSDSILLVDAGTFRILEANSALCNLLGYTRQEILELALEDIAAGERKSLNCNIGRIRKEKGGLLTGSRYRRKDGSLVEVEASFSLISCGGKEVFCGVVRDITHRVRMEEALRASEERYRSIVETTSEGVWMVDSENKIVFANSRMAQMLGYTLEEMVGMPLFALLDEGERALAGVSGCSHRYREPLDCKLHRKDGSQLWALVSASPVFDAGAKHTGCLLTALDITERKRAEEALQKSQRRLRKQNAALVELAKRKTQDSGDLNAAIRKITRTAARTLDVERVSVWLYSDGRSKITCADLFEKSQKRHSSGTELRAADYPAYFQALQEERTIAAGDAHSDPRTQEFSASYLSVLGIASMLEAPIWLGGQIVGVVCHEHVGVAREWAWEEENFARSIADLVSLAIEEQQRVGAEEALRQKEEFLRLVLDNIPQYICWKDRNSVYLGGNRNNARLAGFESPEELVGKTDCDLPWKKEEADFFRECDRRVMETDTPEYHIIEPIRKADGSQAWLDTNKIPLHDAGGNVVGILVAIEDITCRVGAEEALRKSEATNRALLNAIPDLMIRMTGGGTYLDIMPADKNFKLVIPYSEAIGKNIYQVLPPDTARQRMQYVGRALATGETQIYEFELVIDGEVCYEEARIAVCGEDEVLVMVRDISARVLMEKALRESEERYRRIIETTSEGVWVIDAENKTVFVNRQLAEMLGCTVGEMVGVPVLAFIDEKYHKLAATHIQRFRSGGGANSEDFKLRRKDGSNLWVLVSGNPIFDEGGKCAGVLAMVTDITERKRAERELRQAEQKYRTIFENAIEGIFQTTVEGRFLTGNPMLARIYGYDSPAELIATVTDIQRQLYVDPNRRAEFRRAIELRGAVWGFESQMYCKDGRAIWICENAHGIYDAGGRLVGYEGTVEDITERKRAEETIQYQAFYDLLTGLPNRMLFNKRLSLELQRAGERQEMLAVMFVDLDRFKTINDTLGHAIGDRLLQGFAERVTGCLREGDTFARWGGDEFTALLPQVSDGGDAAKIAQRILEALKLPFYLEGHELYISSSIGISLYPQDGSDAETLLRNADAALYRAKEHGRNNWRFYMPAMNSQGSLLLMLENRLHCALERQEFAVYYQPQVNVKTGEISGLEALVRWRHPDLGLVSPGQFIPLAEENGLIVPIGEWVLRTACSQNKAWQDAGLKPVRVAVNLSARQFQQPNLVEMVAEILRETGLDANFLELEITESTLIQNVDFASAMLRDLQRMGAHISMDDFGTGYSSLSYLKRFSFHTIKIDQSFVRDLKNNPPDAAIIAAVSGLARCLDLRVVAEGVETSEQLDLLRSLHCEEMQGYLFSKPLSAPDATKFLQNCLPVQMLVGFPP
jgi:diguanylate cyclase (GGDEF)-like protein/PAS domain S-box-containing protein